MLNKLLVVYLLIFARSWRTIVNQMYCYSKLDVKPFKNSSKIQRTSTPWKRAWPLPVHVAYIGEAPFTLKSHRSGTVARMARGPSQSVPQGFTVALLSRKPHSQTGGLCRPHQALSKRRWTNCYNSYRLSFRRRIWPSNVHCLRISWLLMSWV